MKANLHRRIIHLSLVTIFAFSLVGRSATVSEAAPRKLLVSYSTDCEGVYAFLFGDTGRSNIVRIAVPNEKLPAGVAEEDLVRWVFRYHEPLSAEVVRGNTKENVANALIGPPRGRPSYVEVGDSNRASIESTVGHYMDAGLPIEGVTFWGGAKQYGVGDKMGIDGADLFCAYAISSDGSLRSGSGLRSGRKSPSRV